MFYLQDLDYVPDVLVVNTQESFPERTEWEVRLQVRILEYIIGHLIIYKERSLKGYPNYPQIDLGSRSDPLKRSAASAGHPRPLARPLPLLRPRLAAHGSLPTPRPHLVQCTSLPELVINYSIR